MQSYGSIAFGPGAQRHQQRRGSFEHYAEAAAPNSPAPDGLGVDEIEFLTERDSFYLASVGEAGWPYLQHRGGPAGFVRALDATHLAWADRVGNRQYVTIGNLDTDDRVSIIAVDYPARRRLKVYGHAHFDPDPSAELLERLGAHGRIEGVMTVEVVAFNWNCPQHITPRYTADEVRRATEPLRARIAELENAMDAQASS